MVERKLQARHLHVPSDRKSGLDGILALKAHCAYKRSNEIQELKRIADVLEKLGVSGFVLCLCTVDAPPSCFWVSAVLTREDV